MKLHAGCMKEFLHSCSNTTYVVHYVEEMIYMQKKITRERLRWKKKHKNGGKEKTKKKKDTAKHTTNRKVQNNMVTDELHS